MLPKWSLCANKVLVAASVSVWPTNRMASTIGIAIGGAVDVDRTCSVHPIMAQGVPATSALLLIDGQGGFVRCVYDSVFGRIRPVRMTRPTCKHLVLAEFGIQ